MVLWVPGCLALPATKGGRRSRFVRFRWPAGLTLTQRPQFDHFRLHNAVLSSTVVLSTAAVLSDSLSVFLPSLPPPLPVFRQPAKQALALLLLHANNLCCRKRIYKIAKSVFAGPASTAKQQFFLGEPVRI